MNRAPSVLRCLLTLVFCDCSLRVLGFARTLRIAHKLAGERVGSYDESLIPRVLHNIIVATALYPGRSKCLEQAIAGLILLRRRGVPVNLQLGVQPYPFFAHAWLQLNGAPLTESAEVIARFALLPDPAL
ncbi:MAG TPA: lasso peptide biosynthesis B2 protein [Longimicrobiales bacterium]|nr:lasso peptide biosynthesis B2 protein [Longimicrobiales bacterium]